MTGLGWMLIAGVPSFGGTAVVVADGPLWPGRAATLEVGALGPAGTPELEPPALQIEGGTLLGGPVPVRPGIWRWRVVPGLDSSTLAVKAGDARELFPVSLPGPSTLQPPALVEAVARGEPVVLDVKSSAPLPVERLTVVPSEGQVLEVSPTEEGARVVVALEDLPYPRFVLVGMLDAARDEEPAWTTIRVRTRPRLPLKAEPGAKLTLQLGGREYGPFVADATGAIEARVDQYPGERSASARLVDDLGNETRTEVPLVTQSAPALVSLVHGQPLPGRPPPLVFLKALSPEGEPEATAPSCKGPRESLPVRELRPGSWLVPLPAALETLDVRLHCSLGAVTASSRLEVTAGVPQRLTLRVWPEVLVGDLPEAELSVVLDDARGERLPVDGVAVRARTGQVSLTPGAERAMLLQGRYEGKAALAQGEDELWASYTAPVVEGSPVEQLELRFGVVPMGTGTLPVHVRALDSRRRPLRNVEIELALGDGLSQATVRTGPDGWGSAALPLGAVPRPAALRPWVVRARTAYRQAAALALPGEDAGSGPHTPDLEARQRVRLEPGRVSGISIEVEPDILRTAPGATAWVLVRLEDSDGRPVTDVPIELSATEGELTALEPRADGTLRAEYRPDPTPQPREVQITAKTQTVRSTARLQLEPQIMQLAVGPWMGARTNFGAITSPAAGLDVDMRLRNKLLGESMVLRLSGSGTIFRNVAVLGGVPAVELRSTVAPLGLSVLFRQDMGAWAVWGGGGAQLAVYVQQAFFGETLENEGAHLLIGQQVQVGVARRMPLGFELAAELQGSRLPAPDDDVGYSGNLGGLQGSLGLRYVR